MLILTRKIDESIVINDNIIVKVISIDKGIVKLGIEAPKELEGWLSDHYKQETKEAEAYYFDYDCRQKELSRFQDDDSQELRYHECIAQDERYALSVEVWADGETDVSLVVYTPVEVVAEFWPKAV